MQPPTTANPNPPSWPFPNVRKSYFDPKYNGWQPRFGFAYSVNPKTVVRGAFAMFDDHNNSLVQEAQDPRIAWPFGAGNADSNAQMGRMAFDAGRQEEAERLTAAALRADPDNLLANETLAEVKIREGRYSEAYDILQKLVKLDPKVPRFHYLLGRVLVKLGRPAEAEREFQLSQSSQNAPPAARPMVSN